MKYCSIITNWSVNCQSMLFTQQFKRKSQPLLGHNLCRNIAVSSKKELRKKIIYVPISGCKCVSVCQSSWCQGECSCADGSARLGSARLGSALLCSDSLSAAYVQSAFCSRHQVSQKLLSLVAGLAPPVCSRGWAAGEHKLSASDETRKNWRKKQQEKNRKKTLGPPATSKHYAHMYVNTWNPSQVASARLPTQKQSSP